jgi:DNA-binding GntR family transcriptional regulator
MAEIVPLARKRRALHDEVATRLRDMIVEGELAPGAKITERVLCERLAVSRTPLREAFKILANEGLLTLLPNRGAQVTVLTLAEADDTMDLISVLEARAGELACGRITDAELAAIEALHARMLERYRRGERMEYFKANQAIHAAIIAASGNGALVRAHGQLTARMRRMRYVGNLRSRRWDDAVREHSHILEALRARDGRLVAEVMRAHLLGGWRVVRELLHDELAQGPAGARGGPPGR